VICQSILSSELWYSELKLISSGQPLRRLSIPDDFRRLIWEEHNKRFFPDMSSDAAESKWPRKCGLCGQHFQTLDDGMQHLAQHFVECLDISSWKYPLSTSENPTSLDGNRYEVEKEDSRDDPTADDLQLQESSDHSCTNPRPKTTKFLRSAPPEDNIEDELDLNTLGACPMATTTINSETAHKLENTSPSLQSWTAEEELISEHAFLAQRMSVPQSPREAFLKDLFLSVSFSDTLSPTDSGISSVTNGESTPSRRTTPSSSLKSQSTNTNLARKRLNDEELEDDGNTGREKRHKVPKTVHAGGQSQSGRRLCCPLHAFDPEKYSKNVQTGRRYEACNGPGWFNMHYLK
jgi:hypothetical protein